MRDSDRTRDGFYYFSKPKTPHYPGFHNLGSRDWTSDERDPWPKLGEWEGEREWVRGTPPARLPLPVLVGSPQCIEFGENPALPRVPDVSAQCAKPLPEPCYPLDDFVRAVTNVNDCVFAKKSADIINAAYTDLGAAEMLAADLLGATATIRSFAQPGDAIPAGVIGLIGQTAVLWLTGTTNFNQLALQGFYFGFGPVSQGFYSCSLLYEAAALAVADALTAAGAGDKTRLVLTGHSYGGAVCQVLGAKAKLAKPDREVELLTLGSPKAGDRRLMRLIDPFPQRHYIDINDPIPQLPPVTPAWLAMFSILGTILLAQWNLFGRPREVWILGEAGELQPFQGDSLPDDVYLSLATLISQARQTPRFAAHRTEWYAYYLCLACPCVPRPCVAPPALVFPPYYWLVLNYIGPDAVPPHTETFKIVRDNFLNWYLDGYPHDAANPQTILTPDGTSDIPMPARFTQWAFPEFPEEPYIVIDGDMPDGWWDGETHTLLNQRFFGEHVFANLVSFRVYYP